MMKALLLLVTAALLEPASAGPDTIVLRSSSPSYQPGDRIDLPRELEIAPRQAQVLLQGGRAIRVCGPYRGALSPAAEATCQRLLMDAVAAGHVGHTPPPSAPLGPWVINPYRPGTYCHFQPEHLSVGVPGNPQFEHGPALLVRFIGRQTTQFNPVVGFEPWEASEEGFRGRLHTVGYARLLPSPVSGPFGPVEQLDISADGRAPGRFILKRIPGGEDRSQLLDQLVSHGCWEQAATLAEEEPPTVRDAR